MQLNIKVILCLNINEGWTFIDNYSPFPQPVTGYDPLNDIRMIAVVRPMVIFGESPKRRDLHVRNPKKQ